MRTPSPVRGPVWGAVLLLVTAGAPLAPAADPPPKPVVTVDTSRLVDIPKWGADAARLIEEWFPKIEALLGLPHATNPPAIRLVFREGRGVAATSRDRITVYADWVRAHPEDIGLVVHELVHIVQAYPRPDPGWVTEGLADYIRFWHYEKTPQTRINKSKASYRDSYRTAGAFFAWIEKHHPGTVKRINAAMRASAYRDALFEEATGKSLDELWKEFLAQWTDA